MLSTLCDWKAKKVSFCLNTPDCEAFVLFSITLVENDIELSVNAWVIIKAVCCIDNIRVFQERMENLFMLVSLSVLKEGTQGMQREQGHSCGARLPSWSRASTDKDLGVLVLFCPQSLFLFGSGYMHTWACTCNVINSQNREAPS